MHQTASGEVRHHETVEFLAHQIGGLAAQNDASPAQVGLELIERRFDLPPFVVESRQFFSPNFFCVKNVIRLNR